MIKALNQTANDRGNSPIYMKLATRLRNEIVAGKIDAGDALPSERDLCDIMEKNR